MEQESESKRWILVVEDNPDDEMLATRVFKKLGRIEEFVVARDGEEAVRILQEREAPTLVLLDLKLPRLSGVEVLTSIRDSERLGAIPVVILTSSSERTDLAACYALGCNAFVKKEIDFDTCVEQLKTTFDFWLNVNLPPPVEMPRVTQAA
ncbi:MAG TPA: response regulator [Fimbriimonadaceae bacterium]|nr:response regulator [Fimbriimonadaceae bacterium]